MTKRRWTILLAAITFSGAFLWLLLGREPIQEGRCRLIREKADVDSPLMWLTSRYLSP